MYGTPQQGAYDPSMGYPPQQGAYGSSMGPPPQQGAYDPSMGQPSQQWGQPPMTGGAPLGQDPEAQAAADLAAHEQKHKDKLEHQKEKDIDHMKKMMRSGARNSSDSSACAGVLMGWGFLNALLWAVPLLGDSWWNKIWQGLSIDKLTIVVGLFNLHVEVECVDSITGDSRLCDAMKPWTDTNNGNWAMLELKQKMCEEYKDSCSMIGWMAAAGWSPLVCLPAAAAFEVLAVLFLYFYWHGKPTALVRSLGNKCAALGPFFGVIGFMGWMMMSPYMSELPRFWIAMHSQDSKVLGNSSAFGLKETFTVPMGWCLVVLFFTMISSSIRFFSQFTLPQHVNEPDPTGFDESARLVEEAEKMYDADLELKA